MSGMDTNTNKVRAKVRRRKFYRYLATVVITATLTAGIMGLLWLKSDNARLVDHKATLDARVQSMEGHLVELQASLKSQLPQ